MSYIWGREDVFDFGNVEFDVEFDTEVEGAGSRGIGRSELQESRLSWRWSLETVTIVVIVADVIVMLYHSGRI